MAARRPLVLDRENARTRESRSSEDLKIPLEERFQALQSQFRTLLFWMVENGFSIPDELAEEADAVDQNKKYVK